MLERVYEMCHSIQESKRRRSHQVLTLKKGVVSLKYKDPLHDRSVSKLLSSYYLNIDQGLFNAMDCSLLKGGMQLPSSQRNKFA